MDLNTGSVIDLEKIAAAASLSPFHFLRLFKKIYGQTPYQYLTNRRIEKAKALLAIESYSVSEICSKVGFEGLGSFCTLFKKYTGYTPSAYRTIQHQKQYQVQTNPASLVPNCFAHMFGVYP